MNLLTKVVQLYELSVKIPERPDADSSSASVVPAIEPLILKLNFSVTLRS